MPASAPARPCSARSKHWGLRATRAQASTCGGGFRSAHATLLTRWRSFAVVCVQASTRRASERRTAWRAGPGSTQRRHCRRPHAWIVRPESTRPTTRRPTVWRALQVRMHVSQSSSMRTCTSIAIPFSSSPSISLDDAESDAYLGWQANTRTRQGLPFAIPVRQVSSREERTLSIT